MDLLFGLGLFLALLDVGVDFCLDFFCGVVFFLDFPRLLFQWTINPVPVSVEISFLIRWFWVIMLQSSKTRTRPSRLPPGLPSVRLAACSRATAAGGPEDCGNVACLCSCERKRLASSMLQTCVGLLPVLEPESTIRQLRS